MSKEHLRKGNPEHQFTSTNQPTPEQKSNGWKRKKALTDLANALVNGDRLSKCKVIADEVGIYLEDNEFTLDIAMTLKQIEIALDEGDTKAYNAAMDRLIGKAIQTVKTEDTTVRPLEFKIIGKDDKST